MHGRAWTASGLLQLQAAPAAPTSRGCSPPLPLAQIPDAQAPEQAHLGVFPQPCPECPSLCHVSALGAVTRLSRVPAQTPRASELPSQQESRRLAPGEAAGWADPGAHGLEGASSHALRPRVCRGHNLPHALLTSNLRACGGHAVAEATKSSAKSCLKRTIMEAATSRGA